MKEAIMLSSIDRLSESISNLNEADHEPLRPDELQTLISMAEMKGYSIENASNLSSLQDEISSELYAVWYAKMNDICILADNIAHLIASTGWSRLRTSSHETYIEPTVHTTKAA
jgi:hypothetical protein